MTLYYTYTQVILEAGAHTETHDNELWFTTHTFAAFNDTLPHIHTDDS